MAISRNLGQFLYLFFEQDFLMSFYRQLLFVNHWERAGASRFQHNSHSHVWLRRGWMPPLLRESIFAWYDTVLNIGHISWQNTDFCNLQGGLTDQTLNSAVFCCQSVGAPDLPLHCSNPTFQMLVSAPCDWCTWDFTGMYFLFVWKENCLTINLDSCFP